MSGQYQPWKAKHPSDLPEGISLFPLPAALLLPRSHLPLHIFEPRYVAMVNEALRTPERLVGMIAPIGTAELDPQPHDARLSLIGCAGRISRFHETEDGRLMITLSGISRFRLIEEIEGFTPWRRGRVDWSNFARDLGGPEEDPEMERESFLAQVSRFLLQRGMSVDINALSGASNEEIVNVLCAICPFASDDKQALLEAPSLATRRQTLSALIEFSLLGGDNNGPLQ